MSMVKSKNIYFFEPFAIIAILPILTAKVNG
jgi:hypothetical protein